MIEFLIFLGWAIAYATTAGFAYGRAVRSLERHCDFCRGDYRCDRDHEFSAFWVAIVWPMGTPFLMAKHAGEGDGLTRTQRRRERELEEARHNVKVAKIRAQENALLDKEIAAIKGGK